MGARSDPRRLPRRNHYQEGPGFLFLATENGRPPNGGDLRRIAVVVRRRRAALRALEEGQPAGEVCARYRCSRVSLWRWRERFVTAGITGLIDRYRSTRQCALPVEVERVVITLRLLTYWNSKRIEAEFPRRPIWPVSHAPLDRPLAPLGAHRSTSPRTPGPRYQRDCPNELWHIDLKGPFHFRDDRGRPMHCHFVALV